MRLIVTCMKNEGPFMLEWFAYHISIGFDKFLVYTNDCDDLTDKIADRMTELGLCIRLENPRIGTQRPQAVAMRDMFKHDIVNNADWVLFSDCDEFLNIHLGGGHLDDLLAAMGDAEVISPIWRLFGNSGIVEYEDKPLIEQFFWAAPTKHPVSVNSWGFKSLFRPTENIERIGAHRPFFKDKSAIFGKWFRADGNFMSSEMIERGWRYTRGNGGYDWAQFNHYAVRSVDSFLVKSDRGHVLHTTQEIDLNYHNGMNQNHEYDRSILRRSESFHRALHVLKRDEELVALHNESVSIHRQKAVRLRDELKPTYETLREEALQLSRRLQDNSPQSTSVPHAKAQNLAHAKDAASSGSAATSRQTSGDKSSRSPIPVPSNMSGRDEPLNPKKQHKHKIRERFLKRMPKGGVAIEIGVWRGEFSSRILDLINPDVLHLIDPWKSFEDHDDDAFSGRATDDQMEEIYEEVLAVYSDEIAEGRVNIIRKLSTVAMDQFNDESINFAYVDGDHSYEGVRHDIANIFPKLAINGVIAFDDYHLRGWWKDGVLRAIHEFLGANPSNVRILAVEGAQIAIQRK